MIRQYFLEITVTNLLVSIFIFFFPISANAWEGFYGHRLRFTVDYPVLGETVADILEETVNNDIEFEASGGSLFLFAVPVLVDISAHDIAFSYENVLSASRYATTDFNGYVFTDIYNTIDPIIYLSYETTMEMDRERIWFNENQIFINMSSLDFSPVDRINLHIEFQETERVRMMPWINILLN